MDHFSQEMGVVVQLMVPAEQSGVLFTVDPVAHRSDRMLVEVVEGVGEALVSGERGGRVYRLAREGFRVVDVDGEGRRLARVRLRELWEAAHEVERLFGGPQDLEFGFQGDRLWVLQTRPITTLAPELVEPLEPLRKPTLSERTVLPLAAEHYATAPKPLDNLVFTRLVGGAAEALRRSGGEVRPEDEEAFRREIWRQAYRLPRHRLTWRAFLPLGQPTQGMTKDWTAWWMAGPEQTLREVSLPVELKALSDRDLFARTDAILGVWGELLGDRMTLAARAFRAEAGLRALVTLAVGRKDRGRILADLARGLETPVTESNRALWDLSRKARDDPRLHAKVRAGDPAGMEGSPEGRAFLGAVDAFLASFGHREGGSWYLSTPTWGRDPTQVWRLLASLVEAQEPAEDRSSALESFEAARELVERRLRSVPWLHRRFLSLLEAVRAHIVFREQSHFDLTRPLAALQDMAAEWGRRLVSRGVLLQEESVFYLTPREVRDWILDAPPDGAAVQKILARRRATYQVVNTTWQRERWPRGAGRRGLKGIPASPGMARASVRIIRGEDQFHRLRAGEIMVCHHTNPSWTPLFSLASGVVTQVGGPASHAAIVAREYGIPCIMALPGATEVLQDRDEVLMDGSRGTLHLLVREEDP
jgi:pyruvate,water dikinase